MILGLRAKLLGGFIALALVTVVLGAFALDALGRMRQRERVMYEDVFGGTYLVASYVERAADGRTAVLEYLLSEDPATQARLRQDIASIDSDLADLSQQMDEADTDREDVETLADVDAAWARFAAWRDRALGMLDGGNRPAALASYEQEGAQLGVLADDAVRSFLNKKVEIGAQIANTSQAAYETTRRVAIGAALGAAIFAILVGLVLTRNIASAVGQVAAAARSLARGDLTQKIGVTSRDELGQMETAVNEMIAYQQEVARVANAIADRDLSQEIRPHGDSDLLGQAFQRMAANLRALVSQLQEREQRVRAVLDSVADGVISVDGTGAVESLNPAAERIFGRRAVEVLGQPVESLIPARLGQGTTHEATGRRADGSQFVLDVSERHLEANGECLSILTVRDATQRKEAEAQAEHLLRSEKMRALGQMASGVAHDLNQSLALISGYGELARHTLERARDPHSLHDYLATVVQAAIDGGETVKRLLTFSQTRTEEVREQVDLARVLPEVSQLTAPRWRAAPEVDAPHIELHVQVDGRVVIEGWAHAVREALTNLIFNAVDVLPEGGSIWLRARRADRHVIVEVEDSGPGIPPELQSRIFEPFFTTKGERGTGLGLAQVYGIVKRHDGEISVESLPGRGTTFRIVFPAAAETPEATAGHEQASEAAGPLRILAVDDEPALARMVGLMLKKHGHLVEAVTSGEQALERLEQQPFDLVISDLGLGAGLNGWQVADRVRARWPHVRVILATGWGAGIDPAEARSRGVEAVIAKPYAAERLRQAVAAVAREVADPDRAWQHPADTA